MLPRINCLSQGLMHVQGEAGLEQRHFTQPKCSWKAPNTNTQTNKSRHIGVDGERGTARGAYEQKNGGNSGVLVSAMYKAQKVSTRIQSTGVGGWSGGELERRSRAPRESSAGHNFINGWWVI